ncbi:reverse transcriptase [Gossypium australe]|uniref:Reverse transcriptase n=1 Tax=Gossypium australe TaxID=47621 RepID=A0A5B6WD92_9ROSI|nr:reverse transcriptase [Gossypium australe]
MVGGENGQDDWRFTCFYGSPYLKDKNIAWDVLRRLSYENPHPWLEAGDFNEILFGFEKKGGGTRDQGRMDAFRDILEECQLMDIGYSGTWFTWERGNLPETSIRERLDRGVANEKWITLFPMGRVQHLSFSMSDHCPLLISKDYPKSYSAQQKFHFESWWTLEDSTGKVIKEAWEGNLESLLQKLENLQRSLKTWALSIKNKREDRKKRANWLRLGDKNSAFFHKCATARRQKNLISKLISEDGNEITTGAEINETATTFFKELFTSKGVANADKVMDGIKNIVGKNVTEYCLEILNGEKGVEAVNNTDIVLIPRIPHSSTLVNFRPISLCSVIYKIVAKTVANKLQGVIGSCIDRVQSAFHPGRLISDNMLLAYEILHTFKKKRTGHKGYMAVKLDMSKVYDRVE